MSNRIEEIEGLDGVYEIKKIKKYKSFLCLSNGIIIVTDYTGKARAYRRRKKVKDV